MLDHPARPRWSVQTQLVHDGLDRSGFGETAEALYLTSGYVYESAEQAAAHAEAQERRALLAAIDRLTSPAQMGEVFKVALLVPAGTGRPPGFETEEPR